MFRSVFTLGLMSMAVSAGSFASADDVAKTVAGRTIGQYADDLQSDQRVVRLRAVKSLGALGADASSVLRESLAHDDAAVRYTAAVHLGRLGGSPLQQAANELRVLAADKRSYAVGLAAAYALCENGQVDSYLAQLTAGLTYPERGMACSAAELLGRLGPKANGAVKTLQEVFAKNRPGVKGGDYHVGGAASNALRKIRATESP